MGDFEKIVQFQPAFDKSSNDPNKDYGIHGVTLRMIFKGPKGATQFVLYTGWHLKHIRAKFAALSKKFEPAPADVGYHSYTPRYEGQGRMGSCDVLLDALGGCYYDGSSFAAIDMFESLIEKGSDEVWRQLEKRYHELFDE